jgi:asparagine synthase (glutamine-hydrolysing)
VSGIVCVYSEQGIAQDIARYLTALGRLRHRGPDGEGSLLRHNLFLGVRRSTVGSAAMADQPAVGAQGKIAVALDGHIHNREAVAAGLRAKGHIVDASCDVTLVQCAYAEYGELCFEKLKGIWAIIVWDERCHRLIVSRDRLGVRPLYYFADGGYFLIASEIKSILNLNSSARAMNRARVRDFVYSGCIDDWSSTFFARVQPVPPGTVVRIHADQITSTEYWSLHPRTDRSVTVGGVFDKLVETVERHTPVDVPVGIALSGGIDSSTIAGILARSSRRGTGNLRAFSINPPKTTDESFLIDATIRHTGIPHSYVSLESLDYPRLLAQMIDSHDEPIQFSGVFYQYVLRQRMAEAGCRATLVGYGADEIFSGYQYLAVPFLTALLRDGRLWDSARFVWGARDFLQMPALQIVENALQHIFAPARAAIVAPIKRAIGAERLKRLRGDPMAESDVLAPSACAGGTTKLTSLTEYDLDGIPRGQTFFRALLQCFRTNIALLVRLEDRNAMAHGLELCAPFMDQELVEMVLGLPYHRFMEGGRNKAVLRTAAHAILAPEVSAYARKLATPGNDAFLVFDVLRPQLQDMLSSASFYSSGLWSNQCEQLYRADLAGGSRASLWFHVYIIQKWYETVVRSAQADGRELST